MALVEMLVYSSLIIFLTLLGAILFAYLFYRQTSWKQLSYLVALMPLLAYIAGLNLMHDWYAIDNMSVLAYEYTFGGLVLIAVALYFRQKQHHFQTAFLVLSYLFLPLAFVIEWWASGHLAFWALVTLIIIYGVSFYKSGKRLYEYI